MDIMENEDKEFEAMLEEMGKEQETLMANFDREAKMILDQMDDMIRELDEEE